MSFRNSVPQSPFPSLPQLGWRALVASALALAFSRPGSALALAEPGTTGDANAPVLPVVDVEGARDRSASLVAWSGGSAEGAPVAIDRIDASDLTARGVTSLSSAIRVDPSVGDNYNTFGYVEGLQVRGFTLTEMLNYQRDGLPVSNHVPVALEDKEAVEILKGVSGMLAGVSAPGGLVNYVLKQPTDSTLVSLDGTVSERGSVALHGDFGGRLGASDQFGYRINVVGEERRPVIDHAWSHRALISGFFDWRAQPGTLLQLEFEHQYVAQTSVPGYGLLDASGTGAATTLPAPIAPTINLNDQPWTQPFQSIATTASVRAEQALSADWKLLARLGTQRSVANDRVAFADGCSAGVNYVYNGMCGDGSTDIYQFVSDGERRVVNDTDVKLQGHLTVAAARHDVTLGAGTTRYSERYPYQQIYGYAGTINVFQQQMLAPVPASDPANLALNAPLDTDLDQLYAYDVGHYAHGLSSWMGARASRITQSSSLTDGSQASRLQQHVVTPWLGLGYEPAQGTLLYVSTGSGIDVASAPNHVTQRSTGNVLVIANPGQALPAQRSHQVEMGLKWHPQTTWSLEAALYRIVKPFVDNVPLSPNGAGTSSYLQVAGARSERHQGLELQAQWQATAQVSWRASLAAIDARTTQAADASWVGKPAGNVAPLSFVVQNAYQPAGIPGLGWNNLATFNTHKAVLPDGSVYLPDDWQWDTALAYRWRAQGLRYAITAGVDNVTNHHAWREAPMASWGSIYLFPNPARSARLNLQLTW